MKIQIVTKTLTTKPTARGSYQELEVVYKNLTFGGKVESKKLMSFGASNASFTTLSASADGSVWEVTVFKNDKGFNDWPDVTPAGGSAEAAAVASNTLDTRIKPTANTTKSTYETSEERAQRQILIVRQSSVSSAVSMLSAGAKTPPKVDDVISAAKKFEGYVFGLDEPTAQASSTGFDDLPDFEVEVN